MALPSTGYDLATVDNPASALSDFTLIVDLSTMSASWWAAVNTTDGTRGRAAIHGSGTEVACCWIDFDSSGKTGLLRVLWTGTLASSGTQQLRVYPPNTANATVAASATYGSDNAFDAYWEGYWPLSTDANDRTSNGLNLSGTAPTYGVAGKLGKAADFDVANSEYLAAAQSAVTGPPFTISGWFQPPDTTTPYVVASIANNTVAGDRYVLMPDAGASFGDIRSSFFATDVLYSADGLARVAQSSAQYTAAWHMFSGVATSHTSRTAYLDGSNPGSNTFDSRPQGVNIVAVGVAGDSTPSQYADGQIQHVLLHSTARSAAWLAQEYAQTNDNATFWGTWTWQAPSASGSAWYNQLQEQAAA